METVLDDDDDYDDDDVPDPVSASLPISGVFLSTVLTTVPSLGASPISLPSSLPQSSVLPSSMPTSVPTLDASPRSVPSGASPCIYCTHVRLRRLRDQQRNDVPE